MILKKGIQVKIIAGKDKGKTGEILEINRKLDKIKVKAINMVKRHTKPTKENKGGIVSKESFIHQSNVKNIDTLKNEKKLFEKSLLELISLGLELYISNDRYKMYATPIHLNIFRKFEFSEKKDPITKITKVACKIFALISPKAVQTHFWTP